MDPTEENLSKKKVCNVCSEEKEIREFTNARKRKFRLKDDCLKCSIHKSSLKFREKIDPEYQRLYRVNLKENPEKYEKFLEMRRVINRKSYKKNYKSKKSG